jgi:hypothetical protein
MLNLTLGAPEGRPKKAQKFHAMLRLLFALLLLALPALARERPWYHPAHQGRAYVNPDLTPQRALSQPRAHWHQQLVLWTGRLRQVKKRGKGWNMQLEAGGRLIPVECPRPVLTLNPDPREGCLVAIKGNLSLKGGRLEKLTGRSIILLDPPQPIARGKVHNFLRDRVAFHCPHEQPVYAEQVASALLEAAGEHGLDPLFLASLIQIESAYRKDAVSPSGAIGLGQLMPFTAEGLAVNPWDPQENLKGAARMLAGLMKGWQTPLDPRALALASYNAGPNLVRRLQAIPDYPETTNYVYFIGFLHHYLSRVTTT